MQYEKMEEKTPVQGVRQVTVQDFRENEAIKKARTIVLVLLVLQLIFALLYLIGQCVALGRYYDLPKRYHNDSLAGSLIGDVVVGAISVIYLIIFIIVVVKYIRTAILVFAWLGVIEFILALIVLILSIVAVATASNDKSVHGKDVHGTETGLSVAAIVLSLLSCIFIILTVVYAFKLAKLIKMQQAYQQV